MKCSVTEMAIRQLWTGPREMFFRREFELDGRPDRAVLRIYVDTGYELYLNGRPVAAVNEWDNLRDYDVRLFLQAGRNVAAVRAINGSGHRGFAFELRLDDRYSVVSDRNWRCSSEERWGWMLPDNDCSDWQHAAEMEMNCAGAPQWHDHPGSNPGTVIPVLKNCLFFTGAIPKTVDSPLYRPGPRRQKTPRTALELLGKEYFDSYHGQPAAFVPAQRLLRLTAGTGSLTQTGPLSVCGEAPERRTGPSFCIDFGEECAGYLRIRFRAGGRLRFRLTFGETLQECLNEPAPELLLNRMLVEEYSIQAGTQEFESRNRIGMRFVLVEFYDSVPFEADSFAMRNALYPVEYTGYFHCSDPALNRFWQMSRKTLHLCMHEYYLDAPMRDRFLWTGDLRLEALFNYHLFGERELARFCLEELASVQNPDGSIPSAMGRGLSLLWDYVAWYVIAFRDYWFYTGDNSLPVKYKDSICRAAGWLLARAGKDGLIEVPENPLPVWMVVLNQGTGHDPFLNRLYCRALRAAGEICALAGDRDGVAHFFGLAEQTQIAVKRLLASRPLAGEKSLYGHAPGLYEILEELFRSGRGDAALELMRREWGKLATGGADTLCECPLSATLPDITAIHPECRNLHLSLCHGWSAGPAALLPAEVAGIRPLEPGFRRFRVEPRLYGLDFVRAVVPTPHGEIVLSYEDGERSAVLAVPEGTVAEVYGDGHQSLAPGIHRLS